MLSLQKLLLALASSGGVRSARCEILTEGEVFPSPLVMVAPKLVNFAVFVGREDVFHSVVQRVRKLDGGDGGIMGGLPI